jgi:hypothetical protein
MAENHNFLFSPRGVVQRPKTAEENYCIGIVLPDTLSKENQPKAACFLWDQTARRLKKATLLSLKNTLLRRSN